MLKEAQEFVNITSRPWLLMPGFLIFVAVSMLFVSVFGSFSVADTNTEKSEKSDDNYLLSDIPDELADEPPFDAEAVSEKDAEDYRKWAQRDPRWGQLPMGASG